MEEIWKTASYIDTDGSIETFEGYEVSNLGRVKSLNYHRSGKEKILKLGVCDKWGHRNVTLYKNNKTCSRTTHRLVLSTFNPEGWFEKAVVDHIDSNPENNRLDNLRWVTIRENNSTDHARQAVSKVMKGKFKGSKHPKAQPCVYDDKIFGCILEAYEYAREHGYTKRYLAFKTMIKKQSL